MERNCNNYNNCLKNNFKNIIFSLKWILLVLVLFFIGCNKEWEDHYQPDDQSVNMNLWDVICENENYSIFKEYITSYQLDTLFFGNQQYTIFIPNNEAFTNLPDTLIIDDFVLKHLISPNILNLRNISQEKKLQTFSGKFALIEKLDDNYYFDTQEIVDVSPLFLNGRYYEVKDLPFALPNFEEYFKLHLPVIYDYIELKDSVYLDKSLSKPTHFDDDGNTVYDSIFSVVNLFENRYYPISEESRDYFATFILSSDEQYKYALDMMAQSMGGNFQSHNDIPADWQELILLPTTLDNGIFENILSLEELADPNLLNINGEKVNLDVSNIDPESKIQCSNGVIYGLYNYEVPDSLYMGEQKIEGESLVDTIGLGKFTWKDFVKVEGEIIEPEMAKSEDASEGKAVLVRLGRSFTGEYSVEFSFYNVFPGRHRLVWQANYRPSGVYKIYINDEQISEFDTYKLRNTLLSVTGDLFLPNEAGYNKKDFWVENLTDFGEVRVRFEYKEKGSVSDNGFNIDFVSLISAPL